jgi:hypothetical protein
MSGKLAELRRQVGATRRGLEEAVRRLAVVREQLRQEGPSAGRASGEAVPLFPKADQAAGGLDDMELHFEALGTEDGAEGPKREER